ncbi:DUF222 domain-containing protein [Salinibacterium sp.]|uniref:HNH endonuclease signature motif containing protein n=1 Tax=Salinibacterium sp. TaxID=1915057 RepID=UPI00286CB24B|nr:DUF222 domain-containing protein [Salinibacterium sp.]
MSQNDAITRQVDVVAHDLAALIDLLHIDLLHRDSLGRSGPVADVIAAVESVGRLMDCARVRVLAQLVNNPMLVERLGHASATSAVASLAQISERSARTRLTVATAVCEELTLTGAVVPAARPAVSAALDAGDLGLDAANLIATELASITGRAPSDVLDMAETVMVGRATGVSPNDQPMVAAVSVDFLTGEIRQMTAAADPDGARPREERATRRREFRLGTPDEDGLVPAHGRLLPEVGVLLAGMLEAQRRSPRFIDLNANLMDHLGEPADPRTPAQRRHDALGEIVMAAATADGAPSLDGLPVTVLVTVTAADLTNDAGLDSDAIGTITGSPFPASRRTIERFIDTGGYRVATTDETGAVTAISSTQRCFTPIQRLAMATRDGTGCVTPGCTSPHYTLQAHHVIPDRDGGPTALDNGLLLCFWHHQQVDTGPWQYRMVAGLPYVRGPGIPNWTRTRQPIARVA